jgi:hypothetical protein
VLAIGLLVVPRERDHAHQVRVRALEAIMTLKGDRKPVDAPLAADAADLKCFTHDRHRAIVAGSSYGRRIPCTGRPAASQA